MKTLDAIDAASLKAEGEKILGPEAWQDYRAKVDRLAKLKKEPG